jgi:hypothetical protein
MATLFTALQESDQAPSSGASVFGDLASSASGISASSFSRLTNTSAQIGVRSSTTNGSVSIETYGWIDTRGRNA